VKAVKYRFNCVVLAGIVVITTALTLAQRSATVSVDNRPLSGSVSGTFVLRDKKIELLILWRGSPGWFIGRETQSGGGVGTLVSGVSQYGATRLEYSYDTSSRLVRVLGKPLSVPPGKNVVLVDRVDIPDRSNVVVGSTMVSGQIDSAETRLAPILRQSDEAVLFLRCEIEVPGPANRLLTQFVCDDLKH